eukprot:252394_1
MSHRNNLLLEVGCANILCLLCADSNLNLNFAVKSLKYWTQRIKTAEKNTNTIQQLIEHYIIIPNIFISHCPCTCTSLTHDAPHQHAATSCASLSLLINYAILI